MDRNSFVASVFALGLALSLASPMQSEARMHSTHKSGSPHQVSSRSRMSGRSKVSRRSSGKQKHSAAHHSYPRTKIGIKSRIKHFASNVKAACSRHSLYPANFFMWTAPSAAACSLNSNQCSAISTAFANGYAAKYSPNQLVSAGIFTADPLLGGIFVRREPVKFIILHSTETGRPADAPRVIHSWNRGMRHPGAQFIVDRDGTIYETVDPKYGTVHVDITRTQYGVNNDNAIGIEMVRAGDQQYTPAQLSNVTRLVSYLQSRFNVTDNHVFGHGDVQPSDRTDPVNFNWTAFRDAKNDLRTQATAMLLKKRNS